MGDQLWQAANNPDFINYWGFTLLQEEIAISAGYSSLYSLSQRGEDSLKEFKKFEHKKPPYFPP